MVSVVFFRRHRCVLFRSFQSKMHQKQNFFQKPRSAPSSSFRNNLDVLRGNERSAPWKAILRNPSRKCQEIWESIPQQTTKRRDYQFIRSCRRCKVRSDPKYLERLDFPSLNFYGEKRKKIPGFFFFCRWWRMVQATKRPEKKNALTERSRQLYLRFRWNYRRFYPPITISSRV